MNVPSVFSSDPVCERARCLASLRLDGETSEFEDAFLAAHLGECPGCGAYTEGLAASTAALRSTAPVEAAPITLTTLRRRRAPMRYLNVAAAAAVLAAAGLSGLVSISQGRDADSVRR